MVVKNCRLIAICLVKSNKREWERFRRPVDTHHLRLWVIHHRQQVCPSCSFFLPAGINRMIRFPFQTRKEIPLVDRGSVCVRSRRRSQSGRIGGGTGGGVKPLCALAPWSLRTETQTSLDCLWLSGKHPPTRMNERPAPRVKLVKWGFLPRISVAIYPPTLRSRPTHWSYPTGMVVEITRTLLQQKYIWVRSRFTHFAIDP